jgi:outer membrane immunogenic protein
MHMKKLLLSSAALVTLTAGAMAADLPRRAMAPSFAAVPVFTWTGFYVGVNAGYGWNDDDDRHSTTAVPADLPAGFAGGSIVVTNDKDDGALGGAQVGYNMQFGQFVIGAEGDIQAIDLGNSGRLATTLTPGAGFPAGFRATRWGNDLDWFGTLRARAGFAFDRALIYATGGFAFGGGDDGGCITTTFSGTICGGDDNRTGWTLGGGVEWAFTNNLSVKLEGLWVNLDSGSDVIRFTDTAGNVYADRTSGNDQEFGLLRAGVNWKF